MTHLHSIEAVTDFIHTHSLAFLYISQPNCSVCHGLLPQVQQLLEDYPAIQLAHIDATEVPEVASRFSIFTVPVLLLFFEEKEYIREARIVHLDLLDQKIDKLYQNIIQ
ncbi:thioredoxin family protein [Ornithinibacillus sp. 4-3]|uniref:Thioredoxin family protein n=1 Tax=Ornithinibacillus sp. 4-3 TaxID=3231488 RepID=A0AB39HRZ7_9BACI